MLLANLWIIVMFILGVVAIHDGIQLIKTNNKMAGKFHIFLGVVFILFGIGIYNFNFPAKI